MLMASDFIGDVWLGRNSLLCRKFGGRAELKSSKTYTKNDTNVVNAPHPRNHYGIWRCECIRGIDPLQFEPMHVAMSQKSRHII
jgi:hypothetical protein